MNRLSAIQALYQKPVEISKPNETVQNDEPKSKPVEINRTNCKKCGNSYKSQKICDRIEHKCPKIEVKEEPKSNKCPLCKKEFKCLNRHKCKNVKK